MSDQIFWYISRSAGLVAWLAAAGAIVAGTMIPSRMLGRRPTIPWLTDLHRMLGAMASIFLLVHMAALWFDHFVQFRWADLLVPWVATVPGLGRTSLALGVIAAWLTAAVELTSFVRDRMPAHWWHSIHLTSYLVLAIGAVHAILAGSDVANPIVASLGTSAITAVVLATIVRIRRRPPARPRPAEPEHDEADADSLLIEEDENRWLLGQPREGWSAGQAGGDWPLGQAAGEWPVSPTPGETRPRSAPRRPGPGDRG